MALSKESQKEVDLKVKENNEKVFYSLYVVWDSEKGMQVQQNSNKVGPADIMMALGVVKGLHEKYFIDMFSQSVAMKTMEQLTPEQQEAIKKNLNEVQKNV